MEYPRYSYPLHLAPGLIANILFGGRRSFRRDGQACIERLQPPLRVLGEENIPRSGPCMLTFNHYYRPGFNAWWMALALAAVVPVDIHFAMTGELTYPGTWYAPLGQAGSRWLLSRFGKIYGFTTMPPMPPRARDVARRASAVRNVLSYVKAHPDAILGLAPEGGDNPPTGALAWPASGAGRFIGLLAERGFPILPLGCYEQAGEFCLRFGTAYTLTVPRGSGPGERDHRIAHTVMSAIARQLPQALHGDF